MPWRVSQPGPGRDPGLGQRTEGKASGRLCERTPPVTEQSVRTKPLLSLNLSPLSSRAPTSGLQPEVHGTHWVRNPSALCPVRTGRPPSCRHALGSPFYPFCQEDSRLPALPRLAPDIAALVKTQQTTLSVDKGLLLLNPAGQQEARPAGTMGSLVSLWCREPSGRQGVPSGCFPPVVGWL